MRSQRRRDSSPVPSRWRVRVSSSRPDRSRRPALFPWFVPVLLTGAIRFALGSFGFAIGIVRSRVLGRLPTRVVVGGLVVMAIARFAPIGVAQYVIAVAGVVALWLLAAAMWRHPEARSAAQPRPMPAT